MKKIRILLSLLAIIVGIGGAIASSTMRSSLDIGYEFVDDPQEPFCQPHEAQCQEISTGIPCTVMGVSTTLKRDAVSNCGPELWQIPD